MVNSGPMSCHVIYYKDGAKMMRPVTTEEEYRNLRGSEMQRHLVARVREGDDASKRKLLQMNYSCLPTTDVNDNENENEKRLLGCGPLKGSKVASNSVGMDIDHIAETDLAGVERRILERKSELGLLMLELSARGRGYHLVFRRRPELTQVENLRWASELLGVEFDEGAKDITRVFYTTAGEDLVYLDKELFESSPMSSPEDTDLPAAEEVAPSVPEKGQDETLSYLGIPYERIIGKWWAMWNDGKEPVKSNRDVLTYELAVNLRHICGFDRELLDSVIPCYDGFSHEQKMKCIDSALGTARTQMPRRLRDVLTELKKDLMNENDGSTSSPTNENEGIISALEEVEQEDDLFFYRKMPKGVLPQGVKESVVSTGAKLAMPVLAVTCPMIGALASDVDVIIHGKKTKLNMHSFIVGEAASGKGNLDDVVDAWMAEETEKNAMYFKQESEYRRMKRNAKNSKKQPEELHLPVRFLTMNNTVANLADRLANTEGKHAFSFTPEADTVAMKWKSTMSDFSTMLRQAYDGTRYDREAKSADATTVHIDHLLWNVAMCGTPDALYRVIDNYTDGLLSRFIIAHTPDNTFEPLVDKPPVMDDALRKKIRQVAHLLPLMKGTLKLSKLEARSREWVEKIRRDALKDDDRVMARARLRNHGTAMRMTVCLILCEVAERLIRRYGTEDAEKHIMALPTLVEEMAVKCQTNAILDTYEVLAESLIYNDMLFFRERLEGAEMTPGHAKGGTRHGNGRVYDRLNDTFTIQQAQSAKGDGCTYNSVRQMLKNWKKQGLIVATEYGQYMKVH